MSSTIEFFRINFVHEQSNIVCLSHAIDSLTPDEPAQQKPNETAGGIYWPEWFGCNDASGCSVIK